MGDSERISLEEASKLIGTDVEFVRQKAINGCVMAWRNDETGEIYVSKEGIKYCKPKTLSELSPIARDAIERLDAPIDWDELDSIIDDSDKE